MSKHTKQLERHKQEIIKWDYRYSKRQIERMNEIWYKYWVNDYIWSNNFHIDKCLDILDEIKILTNCK